MKKFIITDLAKGNATITADQVLEIGGENSGGTTGDFIPLSGTEVGKPVTGPIESIIDSDNHLLFKSANTEEITGRIYNGGADTVFTSGDFTGGSYTNYRVAGIEHTSDGITHYNSFPKSDGTILNNKSISYSTDEIKTGGTWIDGKPIYRKYITISLQSGSASAVSFAYPTFQIIDFEKCFLTLPADTRRTPNGTSQGFENDWVFSIESDSSLLIKPDISSAQIRTISGVLLYTKTTD